MDVDKIDPTPAGNAFSSPFTFASKTPSKAVDDAFQKLGLTAQPKWIFSQRNAKWACTVHALGTTFGGDAVHGSSLKAKMDTAVEILRFVKVCISRTALVPSMS